MIAVHACIKKCGHSLWCLVGPDHGKTGYLIAGLITSNPLESGRLKAVLSSSCCVFVVVAAAVLQVFPVMYPLLTFVDLNLNLLNQSTVLIHLSHNEQIYDAQMDHRNSTVRAEL